MRIALLSNYDPTDITSWSGTPYFLTEALRADGHEVHPLVIRAPIADRVRRALQRVASRVSKRHIDVSRTHWFNACTAASLAKQMTERQFDVVLSTSSLPVAHLRTALPIVTYEDATFDAMIGYYPAPWDGLHDMTIRSGHALQAAALAKAKYALYASEWAARNARTCYRAAPGQVAVVPLGANLRQPPSLSNVASMLASRVNSPTCNLLFIGVDWHRKGGDLVVATAACLAQQGVSVRVDVVGCEPPGPQPAYVKRHGFLKKSLPEDARILHDLMSEAHFLFVPSLAECYGLVYAEASAYGLPSLARDTGGVGTVVANEVNGWALDAAATAQDYARVIRQTFTEPNRYAAASRSARARYDSELNWGAASRTVSRYLALACES